MKRSLIPLLTAATAATILIGVMTPLQRPPGARLPGDRPAPEFPTADPGLWINSAPLKMSDLRGRVVLIDVWTFG